MGIKTIKNQIVMIFPHDWHLTLTSFPGSFSNFLEPHLGQIGQALSGFMVI
jgi:hypothetical protein